MSKIKFETLCGATVEVDSRYIKKIELNPDNPIIERDRDGGFKQFIWEEQTAIVTLGCDSSFKVDRDTFCKIGKAMEEAMKYEKV